MEAAVSAYVAPPMSRANARTSTGRLNRSTPSSAGHPGFPADGMKIDHNLFYANNLDVYRERGFLPDLDALDQALRAALRVHYPSIDNLRLTDYRVRVSVRDPDSAKYIGPPELWQKAEATLTEKLKTVDFLRAASGRPQADAAAEVRPLRVRQLADRRQDFS